jgi:hypothetical protein
MRIQKKVMAKGNNNAGRDDRSEESSKRTLSVSFGGLMVPDFPSAITRKDLCQSYENLLYKEQSRSHFPNLRKIESC